jgi:catechol 2,3-dioxygenase-like lactoylglutathione lyase family enzyme
MDMGYLSVSLTVKDLAASRAFYEKLGFAATGGDGVSWQIMVNGQAVIGLFQGMFEKNILTFTPGMNPDGPTDGFTDVRVLRDKLLGAGIELTDDNTQDTESGPAHVVFEDPDGNPVLIDQHV